MLEVINPDIPDFAKGRTGLNDEPYKLFFPDAFNSDRRTFYPGDDLDWEAINPRYDSTADFK